MGRDSVLTLSNFSPALKVFSTTAPVSMFLKRVRTKAPPLPGFTCWKYRIVKRLPSVLMAAPFLNWFVEIIARAYSSIRSTCFKIVAYYRTQWPPVIGAEDGVAPSARLLPQTVSNPLSPRYAQEYI